MQRRFEAEATVVAGIVAIRGGTTVDEEMINRSNVTPSGVHMTELTGIGRCRVIG